MKYFMFPNIWTALSLCVAALVGYVFTPVGGSVYASMATAVISVFLLGVLEVSLSFDNAIANATRLEDMDPLWQRRFMVFGVPIACIGMRCVFPIVIISLFAHLDPITAVRIAFTDPDRYAEILSGAKPYILAFGGTFLGIIGQKFMFNKDKTVHWISIIEKRLTAFGELEAFEYAVVTIVLLIVSAVAPADVDRFTLIASGCMGMVTHIFVEALGALLEKLDSGESGSAMKGGLGAFIFLEFMDASFSFDGVIGAFAITTNFVIIALGLSIGAAYVRAMTLYLVETKALATYKYLAHGAFWAIIVLYAIMMVSICHEISEVATGLIGAGLIVAAYFSSVYAAKKNKSAGIPAS